MSPKCCPDWSNIIERRIASRRPGSTYTSWNIWRRSSLVHDLVRHLATASPGWLAGMSCDQSAKGLTVENHGLTKPRSDCCIHLSSESPCVNIRDLPVTTSEWREACGRSKNKLSAGPNTGQPLFALHLLPTEYHARTGTVPVDHSGLGTVPLREQRRVILVA